MMGAEDVIVHGASPDKNIWAYLGVFLGIQRQNVPQIALKRDFPLYMHRRDFQWATSFYSVRPEEMLLRKLGKSELEINRERAFKRVPTHESNQIPRGGTSAIFPSGLNRKESGNQILFNSRSLSDLDYTFPFRIRSGEKQRIKSVYGDEGPGLVSVDRILASIRGELGNKYQQRQNADANQNPFVRRAIIFLLATISACVLIGSGHSLRSKWIFYASMGAVILSGLLFLSTDFRWSWGWWP